VQITKVTDRVGLSAKTIRCCDTEDTIPPPRWLPNAYMSYDNDDEQRLHTVDAARDLGPSLGSIRELLELHVDSVRPAKHLQGLVKTQLAGPLMPSTGTEVSLFEALALLLGADEGDHGFDFCAAEPFDRRHSAERPVVLRGNVGDTNHSTSGHRHHSTNHPKLHQRPSPCLEPGPLSKGASSAAALLTASGLSTQARTRTDPRRRSGSACMCSSLTPRPLLLSLESSKSLLADPASTPSQRDSRATASSPRPATTVPGDRARLTAGEIKTLVGQLKGIVEILNNADPEHRKAVYNELNLAVVYHDDRRMQVTAGPDACTNECVGGGITTQSTRAPWCGELVAG